MELNEQIAKAYCRFEAKVISWPDFLNEVIELLQECGQDPHPFDEFLEVMKSTSYPEEKQSYQSVEVHCEYAIEIEKVRSNLGL